MKRSISGVILCGGRSSRMHRPKALLPWQGQPLVSHMVERMREFVEDIVVVNNATLELPELAARVVVDRAANLGPLGGIREGLHAIRSEMALITSTDSPHLDASLVGSLMEAGPTAAFEVDGWVEPFPALYARALCSTADRLLNEGKRRPLHLLEAAGFHRLDGSAWRQAGIFDNFNTPEEYLQAVSSEAGSAAVRIELFGAAHRALGKTEVTTVAGTLREVLRCLEPQLQLVVGNTLTPGFDIELDGIPLGDDLDLPLGPGERLKIGEAKRKGQLP